MSLGLSLSVLPTRRSESDNDRFRVDGAVAAQALAADQAELGRVQELQDHHPERSGLTPAQSAALLSVLTDGHRVSVINAPAGSGKTRVMTAAARAWTAAGRGPVIGIIPSQSARNTLAADGALQRKCRSSGVFDCP